MKGKERCKERERIEEKNRLLVLSSCDRGTAATTSSFSTLQLNDHAMLMFRPGSKFLSLILFFFPSFPPIVQFSLNVLVHRQQPLGS